MNALPVSLPLDFWRRTIAVTVMAVAAGVLVGGWWLDIALLRHLHPDFANMKANTAVALAGAGLALWLLTEGASLARRRIGQAGAWLTTAIGILTLTQYLLGWELGIDRLLVADAASGYGLPGGPAPNTALAFVLLGLSLLFLDRQTRGGLRPAEWLALGAALIAWLGLLGYLYGTHQLYRFSVHHAMALHTAALLALLAIGVWLARPRAGTMAVLAGDSPGGQLARRMISIILVSLPLLDVIASAGVALGYYDSTFAAALHVMLASVVFLTAIGLIARSYNQLNLRHVQVAQQNLLLASAIEGTADSILITDRNGKIEYVNPAFEKVTGYRRDEVVGRRPNLVKSGEHPPELYHELWNTILADKTFHAAFINRCKDGSLYHEQKTITPIKDRSGSIAHFVSTGKDITDQMAQQLLLGASEERFRATFEQAAVGIAHVAPDGRWLRVNQKLCDIVGYPHEELLQTTFQDITHPDDLKADLGFVGKMLTGELTTYSMEKRYFRKNGSVVWINLTVALVHKPSGEPDYFISVVEDISVRKRMAESLQDSEARLRTIIEAEPECVKIVSPRGELLQMNAAGLAMLEADNLEQARAQPLIKYVTPEYRDAFRAFMENILHGNKGMFEFEIIGLKGTHRWLESHATLLREGASGDPLLLTVTRDITQRKQAEARLQYLAHYDVLAGLPNRALFTDRLGQAMVNAERHERLLAVVLLDLDQFKKVNDSLGHATGDALLQQAGERLRATLRPGDTVARFGGDEFTLVLADMAHVNDATQVLQKLRLAFETPFRIEGRELFVTVSIGVTLFPFDDRGIEALLRNADIAMHRAKESGRNTWQFYAAEMTATVRENLTLETELRGVIERGELALHYQPQLDLATGRIVAVEALARWHHPRLGNIAPDRFIPIAEEYGLIVPIGEWVLRTACEQAQRWRATGFTALRLAVNISSRQLNEHDFPDTVERILAETGFPPDMLELELTESMLLRNVGDTIVALDRLNMLGARLAIDDFGTGYSSLAYLRRFPIDVLKIDQSFTRHVTSSTDSAAIVRAIITMARALELETVAEGVETADQQTFLADNGCHTIQGYHISKPQSAEAISRMLLADNDLGLRPRCQA